MPRRTVVAIGTFDGVHLGHRAILDRVGEVASPEDLRVVFAFEHPPRLILSNDPSTGLLLPVDLRRDLLQAAAHRVVLAPFAEMRELAPKAFARHHLVDALHASAVVVGEGFRFGRDRIGDVAVLENLGKDLGFSVHPVPAVLIGGEPVSSTRIRSLLRSGCVREAAALLGRPPVLIGRVVEDGQAGERIESLEIDPLVLVPADGVYLVGTFVGAAPAHGLLYVGTASSREMGERRIELRLLESPSRSLRGTSIEVQLLERLRDHFTSGGPEADLDLSDRDIETAVSRIERHPHPFEPIRG